MLTAGRWKWAKRAAAAVGVVVWATWAGGFAAGGGTFDPYGSLLSADHLAFYSAARLVRDGRDGDVYRYLEVVAPFQAGLFPPGRWESLEAFRNPPFYALLYVPTAGLSYPASALLWDGVSVAALAFGVRLLGPARPWTATGWALTFYPVYCVVSYGQNSLLSLLVFAGVYRLLAADRRFLAGLVAGLLWYKPPLLLGLAVWLVFDWRRLWPCACGAAATGAVLVAGSYPVVPAAWAGFVGTLGDNARFDNFAWWHAHGPRAFWRLLLPGDDLGPVRIGLTVGCVAAGVWVFRRVWAARRDDLPAVFGAAVGLTLWVSPHVMIYEWALAVAPAVLWWEYAPAARPAWRRFYAVLWVVMLAATEVARWQDVAQRWAGAADPVVFQASVPVAGWAGWRAAGILILSPHRHKVHTEGHKEDEE